jgi:glyoxylase-like metal-dependent hydrolase (beta-lactamase superfamily II)
MNRSSGLFLAAALLLPFQLASAQDRVPNTLEPITDDLYLFKGGSSANHYGTVLVTDDGILLVDTIDPESAQWLKDELQRRFEKPVKYLVYSHSHYDHIGGSELFKDAGTVIIAQENAEAEILEEEHEHQWMTKRNIALPEIAFSDSFTVKIGGKTVNLVYLGPGHSNSLIAIQYVEDNTVQIVDAANIKQVAYRTISGSIAQYIEQLEKAMTLEFDTVVPGHANIGDRKDLQIYINYLNALLMQIQAAIDAGKTLEETQIGMQMDEFKSLKRWDDWYPLNVQSIYEQLSADKEGA